MARDNLFAININDKSIFDIGVEPGSRAIVNPDEEVRSGDMALVELFGTHVVCFVDFKSDGSTLLRSRDKKSHGIIANKEDPLKIVGKVLYSCTGIKHNIAF